jgi:purine-binding chemotaxis protein CheW
MGSSSNQSLLCRIAGRLCAVPLESVLETMRPVATETLAEAPRFVLGLAIIRGEPMPVVDMGRLISDEETHPKRFVTVRIGERKVALAVDEVLGVRMIKPESLSELPPLLRDAGRDVIGAIGLLDAELLLVLRSTLTVPYEVFETGEARTGS